MCIRDRSTAKGPVKVSAPWVEAGLAVTQSLEDAGPSKGQWKISHTQSGLGIPVSFPTVALAQKFGEWLITFGFDWTRPITKLPDGMSERRMFPERTDFLARDKAQKHELSLIHIC